MKTLSSESKSPKMGNSGDFAQDAKQALGQLQDAVRRVIAAVMVGSVRPTDLGRVFDLDYALAWQIHALTGQHDLLMSGRVVPKPGAMERFLLAAEKIGPENLARNVREAYEAFEKVVSDLAGDRDAFDAMLTLQRPADGAGLRKARRAAHKANAAVWGVTSRCMTRTTVFRERPTGEFDCLSVLGYVGLQRLHADAMVSTLASMKTWGEGDSPPKGGAQAIVECALIEEACSHPLPRIEHAIGPDGLPGDFLAMDGLGKRSEATIFWRNTALAVPEATLEPPLAATSTCRVPMEMLLMDLLVPRGCVREESVRAWVTPDSGRYIYPDPTTRHRLPFEGVGRYMGHSLGALHSTAVPQYADLMQAEILRMGWGDTVFDIFRCEVQYPVLHSAVHLCVE